MVSLVAIVERESNSNLILAYVSVKVCMYVWYLHAHVCKNVVCEFSHTSRTILISFIVFLYHRRS